MFGCLGRLGCAALLLVGGGVAVWLYKDRFITVVHGPAVVANAPVVWEPISDSGAARARLAIQSLSKRSGPVFANVRPGDLASYIVQSVARQLPASAQNVQASVIGDKIHLRADVSLQDFGQAAL